MGLHQGVLSRVPRRTIRRILQLVDQGLSYTQVAEQVSCHRNTVYLNVKRRCEDTSVPLAVRLRKPIAKLRREGKNYEAIARELGCSPGTVFLCAKRWGIEKPKAADALPRQPLRNRLTTEQEGEILMLVRGGVSFRQTAANLGCCEKTVSRVAWKHGIDSRRWCREGLSKTEVAKLLELLERGLRHSEVAKHLGLAETTVARHARIHGHRRRRGPLTEAELDRIGELIAKGFTLTEVALELGLSKSAVSNNARKRAKQRGDAPRIRHLSESQRDELLARFDEGQTPKAIGCATRTVYQHVRSREKLREVERPPRAKRAAVAEKCLHCGSFGIVPCVTCAARNAKDLIGATGPDRSVLIGVEESVV